LARSLNHLATVLDLQGNFTQARELFEESLGLFQEAEVRTGILSVLANLGVMATELDRWEEAETLLEESVQLGREIGDKTAWVNAINHLGVVMQRQGRWDRAQELYEESLRLRRELGDRYGMAYPLLGLAAVAEFRQEHERATRLLSAAISTWTAVNGVPDQSVRWILEDVSHAVQAILDADSYERAAEQGRAMSLEQAVAYALGERGQGRASMP
jgi:tetratricopeptide (TPR) repeat protein